MSNIIEAAKWYFINKNMRVLTVIGLNGHNEFKYTGGMKNPILVIIQT